MNIFRFFKFNKRRFNRPCLQEYMMIRDFNELSFAEKNDLVFTEGKLISINEPDKIHKEFCYNLGNLRVEVIYNKIDKKITDISAVGIILDSNETGIPA